MSVDQTIYSPLEFKIVSISNPLVTVKNADTGGNTFLYNQTLALGQVSNAKRLEFNDPLAQLFTFDARVYGNAFAGSIVGTGSQPGDGTSNPPTPVTYSFFNETKSGALVLGEPTATAGTSLTWGNAAFKGITWDDIPVTTKSDALFLEASLSSLTAIDMDFELRTTDGVVLAESANATAAEKVSAAVQPNTTYILRVKGFANGPSNYSIACKQFLPSGSPNTNEAGGGGGTIGINYPTTGLLSRLVRFTVNPLTRSVTAQILR